jgi:hypothetical protein
MRRLARLRRPIATAFAIWADFALRTGKNQPTPAQRAAERLSGTRVAVIPTDDAPPAKAAPARKPKARRRAKR